MAKKNLLARSVEHWPTAIIGLGLLLTIAWVSALGWGSYLLFGAM